jgi:DNA-binding beta-propeller fold protein YncE
MAAILSTWTIDTLAGNGVSGYSGDGGSAVLACLNEPKGVSLDRHGNVYVADSENHVVRKIDRATGVISTIAGQSIQDDGQIIGRSDGTTARAEEDPLADHNPATNGHSAYTQHTDLSGTVRYWTNRTSAITRYAGDMGLAVHARLNFPTAVAVDREGTLYIADTMNHRVRMVDATTGVITTLAGTGQAGFSGDGEAAPEATLNEPAALILDETHKLYIADQSNHRIRVVDLNSGRIETVAGTGVATYDGDEKLAVDAALAGPSGLALADNRLYVADTFNGRIRCVCLSSGLISTVAGDGATYRYESPSDPPSSSLARPTGIVIGHTGDLFLTDSDNHLIRRWDWDSGTAFCVAGNGEASYSGDCGDAKEAGLCYPFGIAVDHDGSLLVADTFNHRIRLLALELGMS